MKETAAFPSAAILPSLLLRERTVLVPMIGTGIPVRVVVFPHSPLPPLLLATMGGVGMTTTIAANLPNARTTSSGTQRGRAAYPKEAPILLLPPERIALVTVGTGIGVKAIAFQDNRRTHLTTATTTGIGMMTITAARPRHPDRPVTITTSVLQHPAARHSALQDCKLAPSQVWFKAATTSVSIRPPS